MPITLALGEGVKDALFLSFCIRVFNKVRHGWFNVTQVRISRTKAIHYSLQGNKNKCKDTNNIELIDLETRPGSAINQVW